VIEQTFQWLGVPHWYLWEGGFLLIGSGTGVVPPHAHHAIQIVVATDGRVAICGEDEQWRQGAGVVVRPDAVHSFDCQGASAAMLFVDPESTEGIWLQSSLEQDITLVSDAPLVSPVAALRTFAERPLESMELPALIRLCVQALSPGAPPSRRLDPRVSKVLRQIQGADELRIPLESVADMAFLSPSRFAHLFTEQMGLPFRKYVLWRKLTRAMVAIGGGRTIADAAHGADFADAAHLTRTFYQMFGMAPSALMRGHFAEISSPFSAASVE
jgi:AraC family transcriptional regulator